MSCYSRYCLSYITGDDKSGLDDVLSGDENKEDKELSGHFIFLLIYFVLFCIC